MRKEDVYDVLLPELMVLFDTVEPLTFDCLNTKEEIDQRDKDIFKQILKVRRIIDSIDKDKKNYEYYYNESLISLYKACEPWILRMRCVNQEEFDKKVRQDIYNHTNYCSFVRGWIDRGEKPVTFEDFMSGKSPTSLDRRILKIKTSPPQTKEELEVFKNSLSNMFDDVLGNKKV